MQRYSRKWRRARARWCRFVLFSTCLISGLEAAAAVKIQAFCRSFSPPSVLFRDGNAGKVSWQPSSIRSGWYEEAEGLLCRVRLQRLSDGIGPRSYQARCFCIRSSCTVQRWKKGKFFLAEAGHPPPPKGQQRILP